MNIKPMSHDCGLITSLSFQNKKLKTSLDFEPWTNVQWKFGKWKHGPSLQVMIK